MPNSPKVKSPKEAKIARTSPRILVIDDDPEMRSTITEILNEEGYKTTTASNGKEAIDACHKESFDLGLVDIKLPDIDGTTLLQMIKKLRPAMAMMVVTGYPSLENAVQTLNVGAEGYIIKPFKPTRLLEQIRVQLEKQKVIAWENLLVNTGLSSYEAKIYLSLAMNGNSEARKLSLSSGVPRTKAYTALKKLVQRGIVMELPGHKQRFTASPPSEAFSGFVENWKNDLMEQQKTLVNLEKVITSLENVHQQWQSLQSFEMQKQEVWIIKGQEQIAQRINDLLTSAQRNVSITTNEPGMLQLYKAFRKTLDNLRDRHIRVEVNLPVQSSNSFIDDLKSTFKVNNVSFSAPMLMLIVDGEQLLMADYADSSGVNKKDSGLYTKSENIVLIFKSLIDGR